jgi:hypothetical protein
MSGRPVSITRLVKFAYPVDWAEPDYAELMDGTARQQLAFKDMIAVEIKHGDGRRVFVARIERTFENSELPRVQLFRIPTTERYGPWQRRRWEVWTDNNAVPRSETLSRQDVLCVVELSEGALTQSSLEKLAATGVNVGAMPSRDAALPARTQ